MSAFTDASFVIEDQISEDDLVSRSSVLVGSTFQRCLLGVSLLGGSFGELGCLPQRGRGV